MKITGKLQTPSYSERILILEIGKMCYASTRTNKMNYYYCYYYYTKSRIGSCYANSRCDNDFNGCGVCWNGHTFSLIMITDQYPFVLLLRWFILRGNMYIVNMQDHFNQKITLMSSVNLSNRFSFCTCGWPSEFMRCFRIPAVHYYYYKIV